MNCHLSAPSQQLIPSDVTSSEVRILGGGRKAERNASWFAYCNLTVLIFLTLVCDIPFIATCILYSYTLAVHTHAHSKYHFFPRDAISSFSAAHLI